MLAVNLIQPHPLMILPFVGLLLAVALFPFIYPHWWERHFPKVALGLGAITTLYYLFVLGHAGHMLKAGHEYLGFIALMGSLFVVAGGMCIVVNAHAKPWLNCLFLLLGALIANVIGTTGASMLLIRPWIRMNNVRLAAFHIVFFIFIVGNVGGCLTPLGDPPLFLGYLKGVPFWWVLKKCWAAWAIAAGGLIVIFYAFDRRNFLRAPNTSTQGAIQQKWKIEGGWNVAPLALILAAVFIKRPVGLREAVMVAAAIISWLGTPRRIHDANAFNFHPLRTVAWLFMGIFATMVPALDYLEAHAGQLGFHSGMQLFWLTGLTSAALDNAPTYLAFLAASMASNNLSLNTTADVRLLVGLHDRQLLAISLGAVFFGAMTYIGNGPNFLVKSIAEHSKVKIPGFVEYFLKYALPILIPTMLLISLLFFSKWRVF